MRKVFSITGMTCASCVAHVEKAVKKLGAEFVEVSLLLNKMTVDTDLSDEQIIAAVANAGYGATAIGGKKQTVQKAVDYSTTLLFRFLLSGLFLAPLMYFSMGHMFGAPMGRLDPHIDPSSFALIQLVLTTPIIIINGRFFVSGAKSIIHRSPNMDALVSLGSGAAYIYGLTTVFAINGAVANGAYHYGATLAGNLFFESTAMILTLVTLGKFLEAKSKGKTRSEVDKLLRLRPRSATVLRDGKTFTVGIEELTVGDIVEVLPGEYVPCDGVVTAGATTLDKSAITGESMPEEVSVDGKVTSAVLNLTGRIEVCAQKVGEDTTLSKIIELVENAGGTKAPIQKTVDKVSAVFVPIVCGIAIVTLIVWLFIGSVTQALTMAISVLVISCPCALGLATPVAVMAGVGRAASCGVLIKNAEVLQNLRDVKIFALDKTATITEGKPRVTDIFSYDDSMTTDDILRIAGALERTSTHPLAAAISYAAGNRGCVAENSEYRIGYGVVGIVDGAEYALGSTRLAERFGAVINEIDAVQTVYLCKRGKLLGKITVEDDVRETSKSAIETLVASGARIAMLTGDNETQAKRIAEKVGITEVYCNVLPSDKLDIVEKLKRQGKTAMVGDGINDAPALKSADIGIAIGSGTDVAIEAADVVLVKSDLRDVPRAIAVSRASLNNIKQNLFWAFIYNVLGIPIAAGALYAFNVTLNPMIAAGAMAFSSLFVVLNALRLTVMNVDKAYAAKTALSQTPININKGDGKMKKFFKVDGMSCKHCSARVETAIKSIAGVGNVDVDLKTGIVTADGEFDVEKAIAAVIAAGYDCKSK